MVRGHTERTWNHDHHQLCGLAGMRGPTTTQIFMPLTATGHSFEGNNATIDTTWSVGSPPMTQNNNSTQDIHKPSQLHQRKAPPPSSSSHDKRQQRTAIIVLTFQHNPAENNTASTSNANRFVSSYAHAKDEKVIGKDKERQQASWCGRRTTISNDRQCCGIINGIILWESAGLSGHCHYSRTLFNNMSKTLVHHRHRELSGNVSVFNRHVRLTSSHLVMNTT